MGHHGRRGLRRTNFGSAVDQTSSGTRQITRSSPADPPPEVHLEVTDEVLSNRERLGSCAVAEIVEGDVPCPTEDAGCSALRREKRRRPDCSVLALDDRRVLIPFPSPAEARAAVGDGRLVVPIGPRKFRLTGCWSPAAGAIPRKTRTGAWLRLRNVPLHAWTPSCFAKMVAGFGRLVDVDRDTLTWANLEEARVEVDLREGAVVPGRLKVALQGESYWVLVSADQTPAAGGAAVDGGEPSSARRPGRRRKPRDGGGVTVGRRGGGQGTAQWRWRPKRGPSPAVDRMSNDQHAAIDDDDDDDRKPDIPEGRGRIMPEAVEAFLEKMNEKIHDDSSSSSDSDNEIFLPPAPKKKHLFGRTEPLHGVLGGGKSADIILWRKKQASASIVASGTVIWLLFECMGYHLLTVFCWSLILALVALFLWSSASSFLNKAPPKIPEIILPEEMFLDIAQTVRYQINEAFATFQIVAAGKDLKQFLLVIAGLWVLSVIGGWFNFLTLSYVVFVVLYTVPVLYEKYEDHVDAAAERALIEVNKHYEMLDAKVLRKLPTATLMNKKQE